MPSADVKDPVKNSVVPVVRYDHYCEIINVIFVHVVKLKAKMHSVTSIATQMKV